jgi:hypothetical protein
MLAQIPHPLLKVLILPLATLLYEAAGEDMKAAWENAIESVKLFEPRSQQEVCAAIRTLIFNIQANQAAAQASTPGLSPSLAARIRTGANVLARQADKAEHRLQQLRAARLKTQEPAPESSKPAPQTNQDYRQRNLEKKLAKRQEREARLQAQAASHPTAPEINA